MSWHPVPKALELKDQSAMGIEIEDYDVAIYRLGDEYFATDNICTHSFAYMSAGRILNDCIECPVHQGLFNIRTGRAESFPVTVNLASYAVKIENDQLFVEIPDEEVASSE